MMQGELPRDPVMLLSVINTKLRDYYHSLDQLCEEMNLSQEELKGKLQGIDYEYDENRNQFI